jgi:hypothetical protein
MAHKSYVTYIMWFYSLHCTMPYVVFIVVYSIKICNLIWVMAHITIEKKTPRNGGSLILRIFE